MKKEIEKVILENKVGEYLFKIYETMDIEELKSMCGQRVYNDKLAEVSIDDSLASVKINIIDVGYTMNTLNSKINSLDKIYEEGMSIRDLISEDILKRDNCEKYFELFESMTKKCFENNRLNGYSYSISNDGKIERKLGYKYKVKFISKKNRPYVKMTSVVKDDIKHIVLRNSYNVVENEDYIEFPFRVFDKLIDLNCISLSDIIVDKESEKCFYGFMKGDTMTFAVSLTGYFVETWWEYDCPKLIKYYPNIKDNTNWIGFNFPYFENTLVYWDFHGVEVDEGITEEEYNRLSANHKNTEISNTMKLTLESNRLSKEEKKSLLDSILSFENTVSEKINENMEEILREACIDYLGNKSIFDGQFNELKKDNPDCDNVKILRGILSKNEPQILDCGFLYFYPDYSEKNKHLVEAYVSCRDVLEGRPWDSMDVPSIWNGQSTTIKRCIGRVVCRMMKEKYGIGLRYDTVLD